MRKFVEIISKFDKTRQRNCKKKKFPLSEGYPLITKEIRNDKAEGTIIHINSFGLS